MANAQKKTSWLILFANRKTNTAKLPCAFGVHCSALVLNLNSLATLVPSGQVQQANAPAHCSSNTVSYLL